MIWERSYAKRSVSFLSSGTQGRPRLGQGLEMRAIVDMSGLEYLWQMELGMSNGCSDIKVLSLGSRGLGWRYKFGHLQHMRVVEAIL